MFGQPMPTEPMEKAFEMAARADLVLSVGSTLEVEPAASVPMLAATRGAPYLIINRGYTAHDGFATQKLTGAIVEVLPALLKK